MHTTPILQSERLFIRPLEERDNAAIFKIRSNALVAKHLDRPLHQEIAESEAFIQKIMANQGVNSHYWVMDTETDSCIGTICLWNFSEDRKYCEIGYEMHPDFQGKGYAKEAIQTVVGFGFSKKGIQKLEGWVTAENEVSIHLLEKLGFVYSHSEEGLLVYVLADLPNK